jgi:recombination associated protein RdgC
MFKNITAFLLETPIDTLDLSANTFTPCTAQQEVSQGFVPVEGELVYTDTNTHHHIALKTETKRVPAGLLREEINKRIESLPFHPTKAEKDTIKSNVHFELLAKAFPTSKVTEAYITDNTIVVNTSSLKLAEELVSQLRVALGGLTATLYNIEDITFKMTDWVDKGDTLPEGLIVGDSALLLGLDSSIKYKRHDLSCNEIKSHIADGLQVTSLGLELEGIKFTLTEDSQFKSLKFDYESDGFDADCLLLADVVDKLLATVR